ncbi:MAG TPA: DUF2339 domain-containing protein [Kiritimatiellia bacterium]|jgi:uncharacterized membrane protein
MEAVGVLLVLGFVLSPLILSIVALTQSSRVSRELRELRATLAGAKPAQPAAAPPPAPEPPKPQPAQGVPPDLAHLLERPAVPPPPPPPPPPPVPKPAPSGAGLEVAIGGKVASFVGVAALVVAVVFFVGYAIQHGWIGPGTRIILGLLAGAFLVFLGHRAEVSERNLTVLARALTGGGASLFYFCVFAAYKMYHLVGPVVAAVGLIASAAAVLALSMVYASQAVAVLGLVGAYLAPVLLGDDFQEGLFPLIYVAVVNLPVIVLGRRNNWQVLLGLATLSTTLIALLWLGDTLQHRPGEWVTGLVFVVLYYAEFAAVGILRLGMERSDAARTFDIMRLLFASMALLGALEWVLKAADHAEWRGLTYLVAAVAHVVIVQVARRRAPAFKDEVLAFIVIALTFASLALPAQLDGAWVSLGWGIEGALLAWFALRIRSPLLQAGAVGLGLLGLGKSVLYDITLYDTTPRLFFNSRFAVGFLSSVLMGVQGRFHAKAGGDRPGETAFNWAPILYCAAILSLLAAVFGDAFFTLDFDDPWPWAITTLAVVGVGLAAASAKSAGKEVAALGFLLLLVVPVKIVVFDTVSCWPAYRRDTGLFLNALFFIHLFPAMLAGYGMTRLAKGQKIAVTTNILSIGAVLLVVTMELLRIHGDWAQSLVTIWWAVAALGLVMAGLARRLGYLRYCGLAVFAVTVAKVFIIDLAGLGGLQRIAAFFGVGVLMLVLSYAYQRIAPIFLKQENS